MAKKNWYKHNYSITGNHTFYKSPAPNAMKQWQRDAVEIVESWRKGTNVWICKGKYYNWQMKDLPYHYLEFIAKKFDPDSKGMKLIIQELQRRTNSTEG